LAQRLRQNAARKDVPTEQREKLLIGANNLIAINRLMAKRELDKVDVRPWPLLSARAARL
jgi:hypothetical protein